MVYLFTLYKKSECWDVNWAFSSYKKKLSIFFALFFLLRYRMLLIIKKNEYVSFDCRVIGEDVTLLSLKLKE